jgi:hypothetical protein
MMARALPGGTPAEWAKFITSVGVTSVVTLGGGYWVANYVVTNQLKGLDQIKIVSDENKRIETKLEIAIDEARRTDAEFLFYARTICALLTELHKSKANACVPTGAFYPEPSPRTP